MVRVDTCLINPSHQSSSSSCKAKIHRSDITSTFMRPGDLLQCFLNAEAVAFSLDILGFILISYLCIAHPPQTNFRDSHFCCKSISHDLHQAWSRKFSFSAHFPEPLGQKPQYFFISVISSDEDIPSSGGSLSSAWAIGPAYE